MLGSIRKPVIAACNGLAFGGGFEVLLQCDIAVASPDAKVGLPEVTIGVIPGAGGTQRLPRYISKSNAMEMILTGEPIDAETAKERGIFSHIFPKEQLIEETVKLAKKIERHS